MTGRYRVATTLTVLLSALVARSTPARAEVSLAKVGDDWELYSTGRVGAFLELLNGDGVPQAYDAAGLPIHPVGNGGIAGLSDPVLQPDGMTYRQGPLQAFRVRSGFLGNILGLGVRRPLTERTTLSAFIAIWGTTETDSRRTFFKNLPDEREAYMKVSGPAGTLLLGRTLSLFSRGATEIDFLYGHGFAVGNPAGFDTNGPSAGHIGYGVLANVFVAGIAYATPILHGLQLTLGYYDPATFVGLYWTRTKLGRPEAEATYDAQFGPARLHLFVNGAWQKLYATDTPRSTTVYGTGAGGRVEVGPLHLGVAGHYGQGLGVHYFLDGSDAVVAQYTTQRLRKFDGAYVQSQLALGTFDVSLGWGITRVYKLDEDYAPMYNDPVTNLPKLSFLRSQMGISAVVVYHLSKSLHLAADYFRADARWWLGEEQVVNGFNLGSTVVW